MYKVTIKTKVSNEPAHLTIAYELSCAKPKIITDVLEKAELPIVIPGKMTKDEALKSVAILNRSGANAEVIKVDDKPENPYGDMMSYSVKITMLMPIRDRAIEAMRKVLKIELQEARRMAWYSDSIVLVDGFTLEAANSLADELINNGACVEISEGTAQQPVMAYQANTIRKYCPHINTLDTVVMIILSYVPYMVMSILVAEKPGHYWPGIGIVFIYMVGYFENSIFQKKLNKDFGGISFILSLIILGFNHVLTFTIAASVLSISIGLGLLSPRAVRPMVDQFPYVMGVILLSLGTYGLLGWQMAAAVAIGSSIVSILLRRNRKRARLKSAADPKYTVILKSPGESVSDTVRRLRSVIPVKPYEAERIIRTVPVTLLDGVDAGMADQTRQTLEKAGAIVEVIESTTPLPMMVYTNQGNESAIDTIQSRFVRGILKWMN